ncbi:simnilar to predicted protein from Sclerotinia sclerotiorum [Golovinomyces cichoracearum]|uniref:Retrotransposon gag domain-containing protein n=1 Tax=Golovinomyces cichoracearum TaxID=62708 RepID=A0A420IUA7_9PEZI|nr:simnilar to predicted protein from Sclerotinia sclerotiorum [Golovinomyces cichoracearum]
MADQTPHNINFRLRSPVKPLSRKGALPRTPPKAASPSDAPISYPTSSRQPGRNHSDEEANSEQGKEHDEEYTEDQDEDEMDTIDTKDLLLEIRKMKKQMEIAEKRHADTTNTLQNQLLQHQNSQREVKFENKQEPRQREKSTRLYSQSQTSEPPLFPPPARLEKVPHLPEEQKLASSTNSDAAMWRHIMTIRMNRYENYFCDDIHRIEYIYENTKDDAAKFLRSYILNPPSDWSPEDFIDFASDAFTDPAKRENATAEFERLMMSPRQLFWDFWKDFRTLAADTEYRDDRFLREQLRSKVLIRLSNAVQTEWVRCRTINDYVRVLQDADAHYQSTQYRQKRHAITFTAANERHSHFPYSSVTSKSQKQTVRYSNYKDLSNSADNKSDNSSSSSSFPRSFHESVPIQRKNSVTPGNVEIKQRSQTPGRIYEISTDPQFDTFEDESLVSAEQNWSTHHVTQAKDEA